MRKLLLVGWDGADWDLITPRLDRGEMPALNALIDRGVMARLSCPAPLISPPLWTSLATGQRADRHGVLSGVEPDEGRSGLRPVRAPRHHGVPAVWEILQQAGLRTHVLNWYASHPAHPAGPGVSVTDAFARSVAPYEEPWPVEPGSVTPTGWPRPWRTSGSIPAICAESTCCRSSPSWSGSTRRGTIGSRSWRTSWPRRPRSTRRRPGSWSMSPGTSWPCTSAGWSDWASFLPYAPPRLAHVSEADFALSRGGRLGLSVPRHAPGPPGGAGRRGRDGAGRLGSRVRRPRSGRTTPVRAAAPASAGGVFCVAGPGLKRDELIHGADLLDVTPTILTLFGLPVGEDMPGRPLLAAWEQPARPARIPTWTDRVDRQVADPGPDASDEVLAELLAQGYEDAEITDLDRRVRRAESFNLAMVHLDAGHPDRAAGLLEGLHGEEPGETAVTLYLAYCRHVLGDHEGSRRLIETLGESHEDRPLAELLTAMILIAEGRPSEAIDRLERARMTHRELPQVFCLIGKAYLKAGRPEEAERAYRRALELDGDWPEGASGPRAGGRRSGLLGRGRRRGADGRGPGTPPGRRPLPAGHRPGPPGAAVPRAAGLRYGPVAASGLDRRSSLAGPRPRSYSSPGRRPPQRVRPVRCDGFSYSSLNAPNDHI